MASVIRSVSLTLEEDEFVNINKLSCTALLKEQLYSYRDIINNVSKKRLDKFIKLAEEQRDEIERLKKIVEKYKVNEILETNKK